MPNLHSRNCSRPRQPLPLPLRRIGYTGLGGPSAMRPSLRSRVLPLRVVPLVALFATALPLSAQSPSGPMTPQPGAPAQQAPPQPKIGVRVTLVNTPVTVRDSKGDMVD